MKKRKKSRIPEFKSREEEAHFWDTHDITDYWDEMEPVEIEFIDDTNKEETLTVRINSKFKKVVERESRNRGISVSDLTRMSLISFLQKLRKL